LYGEAHACEIKDGHEMRAALTLLVLGAAASSIVVYSASGPWSQGRGMRLHVHGGSTACTVLYVCVCYLSEKQSDAHSSLIPKFTSTSFRLPYNF